MKSCVACAARWQQGFSYVEILIVTALLALVLVPATQSVQLGARASTIHETRNINMFRLQGRMEKVLAQSLEKLRAAAGSAGTANATYSDAVATPDRLLVYIARYDGANTDGDNNPFTGGDNALLWVKVTIENSADAQETLVNGY